MTFFNRHRQAYCPTCRSERTFRKPNPQHGFHAAGAVLTLGLWLIPWAAFTIHWFWRQPWRCRRCRSLLGPQAGEASSASESEVGNAEGRTALGHGESIAVSSRPGDALSITPR